MAEHKVKLQWSRTSEDFSYKNYNRAHQWDFGHGVVVTASAAPAYLGDPEFVDPEQAFVASLSSCHMLTFLSVASTRGFKIDQYEDEAVGELSKNAEGKMAVTTVKLHPKITFSGGKIPDEAALQELHDIAHRECFLANSVQTDIQVSAES